MTCIDTEDKWLPQDKSRLTERITFIIKDFQMLSANEDDWKRICEAL
jgi:hypothetical protein